MFHTRLLCDLIRYDDDDSDDDDDDDDDSDVVLEAFVLFDPISLWLLLFSYVIGY